MEYRYSAPDFVEETVEDIISDTTDILLEKFDFEMPNKIYDDLEKRLIVAFNTEKEDEEEKGHMKFFMICWGGEVWDSLHTNGYTYLLCENYYEMENSSRCISPVYAYFPYEDLKNVCIKHFENYWKKEDEYLQYNVAASIIQRAWRKSK